MSKQKSLLVPYALFAFALGFAWFVLAPLVPDLMVNLRSSLGDIILFISLYGYAMIAGSLPAGFWVAKKGPKPALRVAIVLTVAGLLIRAWASHYGLFLLGQILAALAYPFLIAPIGSVLRLSQVSQTRVATGLVIGTLFLGMSVGSFLAPHFPAATDLWLAVILNLLAGIWLWSVLNGVDPRASARLGKVRMVVTGWWLIGFVIASVSVMFGTISAPALIHLHVPNALALGGLLSSLTFLGSAVGAGFFGWLGQMRAESRRLQRVLGIFTLIFMLGSALLLTGVLSPVTTALDMVFFVFGLLSNGWYALALESSAAAAENAGSAGLATAGYSMASNIGVAIVPVILGPLALTAPGIWILIVLIMVMAAVLIPFIMRVPDVLRSDHGVA